MTADLVAVATQALAVPVSAGIFLNGLEELLIDVQYFARGLHRRERRAVTMEELSAAPPKRIAIMVAAWHEADVIESMLEHNRRSLDYDPALYDIFCGTYQNDPDTQARVTAVAQRYTNVHKVVVPHDGPTSKADCLNWIYQGIVLEEKRRGQRFDILLMHDAEDLIHPLALRLYASLIPGYEFVQTPVFSLPLRYRDVISSTYIDEFAEHHLKDMLVREAIGGLVPSAGVGSAFARDAFEEIAVANDQHPFNVDSLTEDYEVGLKFRLAGKRVHFACRSLQRVRSVPRRFGRGEKQVVEEELIATREYFPNGLASSVRQRARWITGIALQTWRQIGWRGPAAVRYCLWRDRKVIATNSLLLGAYALIGVFAIAGTVLRAPIDSFVPPHSLLWWLMSFNLFVLAWRAGMKMNFVGRLYGVGHAIASLPRLVVANVIGLAATGRAIHQFAHHVWTGEPLRWAKTAHEFPSFEVLAAHQRRLGEFLVDHGRLTQLDVDEALRVQSHTQLPLGEILSSSGMLSAREVTAALGENLAIPYAEPLADEVPLALLRRLPESLAAELDAMPVALRPDGSAVIAMTRPAHPDEIERLLAAVAGPVHIVLAEAETIRRGRWRAYRRLAEPPRVAHLRLGEALLEEGAIDLDQLDSALEEQLETGERLGELLIRRGLVAAEQVARVLCARHGGYRAVAVEDVDTAALRLIGYSYAAFYQLAPLRSGELASPFPIHPNVRAEIARRLQRDPKPVLSSRLELRVALALSSRKAWPTGVALHESGFDGAELGAMLAEPTLARDAVTIACGAHEHGLSPIEFLESRWHISAKRAGILRARSLGLSAETTNGYQLADGLLPPELVGAHGIRVCELDATGIVLAAAAPSARLAHRVAELFVDRPIAWRVLLPTEAKTHEPAAIAAELQEAV
ncbi:MAG TPA: glycosyl transferase family protein [Kofleriaceae bacterium]